MKLQKIEKIDKGLTKKEEKGSKLVPKQKKKHNYKLKVVLRSMWHVEEKHKMKNMNVE